MEINGYNFIRTCDACPEQYDIYSNGEKVGYVRLRFGCLTVDYNNAKVYHHCFRYDEYKGSFDTNVEREIFLKLIAKKLKFEERRRVDNG